MSRAWHPQRYGVAWVDGRCISTGKLRYVDEHEATIKVVNNTIRAMNGDGRRHECAAYPCSGCRGWHLTSRTGGPWGADIIRAGTSSQSGCGA
jgi:hypothetical protein